MQQIRLRSRQPSPGNASVGYQSALARDLPIGSGEIESAHRHVVQQRLKRPGAWGLAANTEHIIALRILRTNGQWNTYWAKPQKLAA